MHVLPNGNLLVSGEKQIGLKEGEVLESGKAQALAQDFLHGAAHRVLVVARHRFQLFAGDPQPRFQCVGGIQHAADRALAALSALAGSPRQPCDDGEGGGQQGGQDEVHAGSLRERRPRGKPGAGAARADRCIALI